MTKRPYLLSALLAATACSNSTDVTSTVAEVRISPEGPSIDVGLSVQFSATALNSSGQLISGLQVSWASSDGTVASVDAGGLAVGLSVGTSAITATIGGVSDSEVLIVEPSQCVGRVEVVLNEGEFQAYPGDTCLLLPSGQAGDRYRVAVARPTLIGDPADVPNVTLEINPILGTAAAAEALAEATRSTVGTTGPALAAGLSDALKIDATGLVEETRRRARTRAYHLELRQREIELGFDKMTLLQSRPQLAPTSHLPPPDRLDVDLDRSCSTTDVEPARRIDFNGDIVVYQDSVDWAAAPISTNATFQLFSYYTAHTKSMVDQYWGAPPDLDGNGRLIVVAVPPASLPDGAAASVWSGDLMDPASCAGSNQAEVVYLASDVVHNLVDQDPSYFALSVLAHEAKHISSLYESLARGQFHSIWIEEGTAEISQVMSSRIAWESDGGTAVGDEVTGQAIIDYVNNRGDFTPEIWGLLIEILDLIVNMSTQPNSLIVNPDGAAEFHTFYAQAWQLHRFIGDAWGNASTPLGDASLFRALTDATSAAGPAGLAQQTGRSFDELYEDLLVAISTHQTGHAVSRQFSTWDLVSSTDIFTAPPEAAPEGVYPWPVTTQSGGSPNAGFVANSFSGPIGPSGMRFHDFVSGGIGSGAQVSVTGAENGTILVTRLR